MANEIVVTAAKVGIVDPLKSIVKSYIASVAIGAGEAVYIVAATGKVALAGAAASNALSQCRGIALQTVGVGQAVDVLEEGELYGFTLTTMAYNDPLFLNDTVGALATVTAGSTTNAIVGCVAPLTDKDLTKVARISIARYISW